MIASVLQRRRFGIPRDPEPEPLLHKFSSTQVQIIGHPAEIIRKMGAKIPAADIGPEGCETEPHVTCKYGLHFQSPSKRLREALQHFGMGTLTFGKTSLFENEDADVLKVDVVSPDLHRLNALVTRLLPTEDSHPKYIAHCTICYLKPGRGKKYAGDAALNGQKVNFDSILFTGKRGHREVLPLTGAGMRFRA